MACGIVDEIDQQTAAYGRLEVEIHIVAIAEVVALVFEFGSIAQYVDGEVYLGARQLAYAPLDLHIDDEHPLFIAYRILGLTDGFYPLAIDVTTTNR